MSSGDQFAVSPDKGRTCSASVDTRPPLFEMWFEAALERAEASGDPDAYFEAELAHQRCADAHLKKLWAAECTDGLDIHHIMRRYLACWNRAHELAAADGFPSPT